MTLKKRLETFFQGWLPKESNLPVCQSKISHKRWHPSRRFVLPLTIGAFMGGLIGVMGSFLDWTAWLGPYFWPILVCLIICIVSGTILAQMKTKRRATKECGEETVNLKNRLESVIRGWFPKEPSIPRGNLKMVETKVSKTNPLWKFLPLIIISCIVLAVLQVVLYLLAYIDLLRLFGGVLVLFLTFPLVYAIGHIQTRYQQSKSVWLMNRIAFILGPACLALGITLFGSAFIIGVTGSAPLTSYLGLEQTFILIFIVAPIVGASIGYLIGRRRDFMPYI